jgi:peptidyl-prolyl cis-trans isomerase B (cyclophilin B)
VFGKVIEGMDVVSRIENTKTNGRDSPVSEVIIDDCGVLDGEFAESIKVD